MPIIQAAFTKLLTPGLVQAMYPGKIFFVDSPDEILWVDYSVVLANALEEVLGVDETERHRNTP